MKLSSKELLREAIAGVTTFFTMAYIVIVNPSILSTPGTGMDFDGVLTATVLLCFVLTLLMGLYAKLPFAVAPGMGINAFFAFTMILGHKIPWPTALGMVFWAGCLFLLVSLTSLRETIAKAIPPGLRIASATGIGLFLTFIGLKNSGFVVADPETFVRFGGLSRPVGLSLVGMLIMVWLMLKKSPFAFLAGIFVSTLLGWALGMVSPPEHWFSKPNFHTVFLKLDPVSALKPIFLGSIVSILFTDLFDSISTFIGVSQAAGLVDEDGHPKNLRQGLIVDAFATTLAGLFGTSSGTAYIESSAGIEMGGKTGWTSVFTALCFLPCFFLAPIAGMVPAYATAPVLILVGSFMFKTVAQLDFYKMEDAIPAFLTVVLIPLTFSITQGILWGFISHVALYWMVGRKNDIHPMMLGISALSVGLLLLEAYQ